MGGLEALGIAILRIVVGIIYTIHGSQKLLVLGFAGVSRNFAALGLPAPDVSAVAVSLLEFIGGMLLMAGLFARPAAVLLAIEMAVAILAVHLKSGFFLPRGFEYPLALLAANIALALTGAGAFALDVKVFKNRIF
jgi:putative oxidoreductase